MKALQLTILILVLTVYSYSQSNSWNGLIPLKSTRSDVENLLGKPRENGGYLINNGFVSIQYSEKLCENKKICECMIGKDTVIKIRVYLHQELKFNDLNLNLKKFKKKTDEHLLVYDSYSNFKEGVVYTVFKEENTVESITYLPSKKDCKGLLNSKIKYQKAVSEPPNFDTVLAKHFRGRRQNILSHHKITRTKPSRR